MPVCDVSAALISLILNLVDGERGRYVRGHGGGMNIVDDRHGGRPAGTERWINSGLIDKAKILPLSILEREACYFMFSEPAVICHNMHLATEAIGLGGWMHCGFLSLEIMQTLGFRMVEPAGTSSYPNPVGFDGVLEGCCPPYFPTMDAAVDAVAARMAREGSDLPPPSGPTAHKMSDRRTSAAATSRSATDGIACAKAVCNYIYDTYGRFPASADTMHHDVVHAGASPRPGLLREVFPLGCVQPHASDAHGAMAREGMTPKTALLKAANPFQTLAT